MNVRLLAMALCSLPDARVGHYVPFNFTGLRFSGGSGSMSAIFPPRMRVLASRSVLAEENSRDQQLCLTQLERIEDLVDAARLEVPQSLEPAIADSTRATIVDELETELQAAREALAQIQQAEG